MKNTLLLFTAFLLYSMAAQSQQLSSCQVEVWKGRKTNYKIDKIAAYTGNDFQNAPIEFYWGYSLKTKVWEKNSEGIFCLVDNTISDSIYRVKDTINCRDFKLRYIVSYQDVITEGTKLTVKGICKRKITPSLEKALTEKLLSEGLLLEVPDRDLHNWEHVYYVAIRKYQEKYSLNVGLLTQETAKHMNLSY